MCIRDRTTTTPTQSKKLTVITHDSFALADETVARFKSDTGYDLSLIHI